MIQRIGTLACGSQRVARGPQIDHGTGGALAGPSDVLEREESETVSREGIEEGDATREDADEDDSVTLARCGMEDVDSESESEPESEPESESGFELSSSSPLNLRDDEDRSRAKGTAVDDPATGWLSGDDGGDVIIGGAGGWLTRSIVATTGIDSKGGISSGAWNPASAS